MNPPPATPTARPKPDSEVERFGPQREFGLHLAITGQQRLACWRLVYQEYLSMGYVQPQAIGLRYTRHDALPETGTFLMECGGEPAGTISIFPDTSLRLPADEIYSRELDALRQKGRTLAEIGRLTIPSEHARDRKLLMKMIEIPCLYAREVLGATDVVITVNPSHQGFYERMMLFEVIGREKQFDSVCGAPAVLLRMDLSRQAELIRLAHEDHVEDLRVKHTVYRTFRSPSEARAFGARVRNIHRPLPPGFLQEHFTGGVPIGLPLDPMQ